MKKISIIGFGGHVIKNILPAFIRSNVIEIEGVYVRNLRRYKDICSIYNLDIFSVNEISSSEAEWFYIATPIATHYDLVKKCLLLKKNVICEKPLTLSKNFAVDLYKIADDNNVILYEVDMYKHHNQYKHLKEEVNNNSHNIRSLSVKFSIPHLDNKDIRYNSELGGGALRDVGYYPISLIMSLFQSSSNINSSIFSEEGYTVDLFGSAIFSYDNFYCIAEWGIGQPYENKVTLITENSEILYDRIFSKPHDYKTNVVTKKAGEIEENNLGHDDQFLNMFFNIPQSKNENLLHNKDTSILVHNTMDLIKSNGPFLS
tara:strand:+ start:4509 stop:5456 length:948 start_codon:yes stop_codon:yes gene_type:complete